MPRYDLFGDTSGLPVTTRSGIPYEIEALSPREVWGAGNNSTTVVCKQTWEDSATWVRDMVGESAVVLGGTQLLLQRRVPEVLPYNDGRTQYCSVVDETDQGENPGGDPAANFSDVDTGWPRTRWLKYRATFEAFPFAVLSQAEMGAIATAAGSLAGAIELYRYVIRSRKVYTREQPIPAATAAGGFKVIDDVVAANRKPIGQIGFRVIEFADIQYKWVRVPVGWPPPLAYAGGANPWPPSPNPLALDTTKERARDKYAGTINSDWFDAAAANGYACAPGTLLYLGYDDSYQYYDSAGAWVCDVVYSFKWKGGRDNTGAVGGWNKFLDATGVWREVSLSGLSAGVKPYTTNNFNHLFMYA
jgi:hypothetical protein